MFDSFADELAKIAKKSEPSTAEKALTYGGYGSLAIPAVAAASPKVERGSMRLNARLADMIQSQADKFTMPADELSALTNKMYSHYGVAPPKVQIFDAAIPSAGSMLVRGPETAQMGPETRHIYQEIAGQKATGPYGNVEDIMKRVGDEMAAGKRKAIPRALYSGESVPVALHEAGHAVTIQKTPRLAMGKGFFGNLLEEGRATGKALNFLRKEQGMGAALRGLKTLAPAWGTYAVQGVTDAARAIADKRKYIIPAGLALSSGLLTGGMMMRDAREEKDRRAARREARLKAKNRPIPK